MKQKINWTYGNALDHTNDPSNEITISFIKKVLIQNGVPTRKGISIYEDTKVFEIQKGKISLAKKILKKYGLKIGDAFSRRQYDYQIYNR